MVIQHTVFTNGTTDLLEVMVNESEEIEEILINPCPAELGYVLPLQTV